MKLSSYIEKWSQLEQVKSLSARQKDRFISMQLKRLLQGMASDFKQQDELNRLLHDKHPSSGLPPAFWLLIKGLIQCSLVLVNLNSPATHAQKSLLRFALEKRYYRAACDITDNFLDFGHDQSYIMALNAYPKGEKNPLDLVLSHASQGLIKSEFYRKTLMQLLERFSLMKVSRPNILKLHQILTHIEKSLSSKEQKHADAVIHEINLTKEVGTILEKIAKRKEAKLQENHLSRKSKRVHATAEHNTETKTATSKSLLEKQKEKLESLTDLLNEITEKESEHFESLTPAQKSLAIESNRIHQLIGKRFESEKQTCCEFEKESLSKIKMVKSLR